MVEILMYVMMLAVILYLTIACLCSNFITLFVVVGYVDNDGAHDDVVIVKFVMLLTLR